MADWRERQQGVAAALEAAHVARDRAVLDAWAAGVSPTEISRGVGLSRRQVYGLLEK